MEQITTPLEGIISRLNPMQKEAVLHITGPELVIAGAGSGKTSVLTARIALLMDKGILPERILALTFTKKAADEMRKRIVGISGDDGKRLRMGTFHSVFISFLRPYATYLGFNPSFTILDEEDSLSCIKRCIKDVLSRERPPIDTWTEDQRKQFEEEDTNYKPKVIRARISMLKNHLITVEQYANYKDEIKFDKFSKREKFVDIYKEYRDSCWRSSTMDFDDILLYTDILFTNHEEIRRQVAANFDYILVDEYQDTNVAQYEILRKLTVSNKNICVVGDDSQSIYAFRGAKIRNIFSFEEEYRGCKKVKLEQNYRSTKNIVNAANRLIANNEKRIPKTCFSAAEEGSDIEYIETQTERDEAQYIVSTIIAEMKKKGLSYKDFAILYRTNAQSRVLEDCLIRKNIPYIIYSGVSFFERMEVKDHMAYLRLAVNPNDDEAFRRVVNKPTRGFGDAALTKLSEYARVNNWSLWQAACSLLNPLNIFTATPNLGFSKKATEGLQTFVEMMAAFIELAKTKTAFQAAYEIVNQVGLYDELKADEKDQENMNRADNVRELVDSVKAFEEELAVQNKDLDEKYRMEPTLESYLQNVMLLTNADTSSKDDNKVNLMTVHCAKGLEFHTVFVAGLEETLFPLEIEDTPEELEEERRLFYVAVTRAEKDLVITGCQTRMKFGKRKDCKPSKFIKELLGDLEYEDIDIEES